MNRRWWIFAGALALATIGAHLVDAWVWANVRDLRVNDRDWGRMLRSAGYLPTWLIVAIGLWTHDRPSKGWGYRGGAMLLGPIAGGALGELLKLLVRRKRPTDLSPEYLFRPFAEDPWSTRGLGMPSSHGFVAFAAAGVLARLFPQGWWLWYLVATGCVYTRVLSGGHYLSDVVVAAGFGVMVGWWIGDWGITQKKRREQ